MPLCRHIDDQLRPGELIFELFNSRHGEAADELPTDIGRRLIIDQGPVGEEGQPGLVGLAGNHNRSGRNELMSNERQLGASRIVRPNNSDLDRFGGRRLADRIGEQPAGKPWCPPDEFRRTRSGLISSGRIPLVSGQLGYCP
jgi:hypothetical protein